MRYEHDLIMTIAVRRLFNRAIVLGTAIDVCKERLKSLPLTLCGPEFLKGFNRMSADLQPEIDAITQASEVIDSALVLIRSIPVLISTATEAVLANGATAEQLQPLADLSATLSAKAQELAQAVVDNTPAA